MAYRHNHTHTSGLVYPEVDGAFIPANPEDLHTHLHLRLIHVSCLCAGLWAPFLDDGFLLAGTNSPGSPGSMK